MYGLPFMMNTMGTFPAVKMRFTCYEEHIWGKQAENHRPNLLWGNKSAV